MEESNVPPEEGDADERAWSRREFLAHSTVAGMGLALTSAGAETVLPQLPTSPASEVPLAVPVMLQVNGKALSMQIEPRVTLLDALRERAGLVGAKKGCDHGQCGACTVHINGRRVLSCLNLAIMQQGQQITTIEGLAQGDKLHPMQAAFIEHDGYQCGFCTPGQVMSAVGLVAEDHAHTPDEIREEMSGNICRCGAYPNIVEAVRTVLDRRVKEEGTDHAAL